MKGSRVEDCISVAVQCCRIAFVKEFSVADLYWSSGYCCKTAFLKGFSVSGLHL